MGWISVGIRISLRDALLYTASMSAEENLTEPQYPSAWRKLFKTPEGRILLVGITLTLAGLIAMVAVSYWSVETSSVIGAMSFARFIFGRTVSMSIGYADGYGLWLAVLVNIWVETVIVLLFYPVFVLSMGKLVAFPKLAHFLESVHAAAERHHETVHRIGLYIFVLVPFLIGPVAGCVIGFLLGLPASLTLWVVLVATYIATAAWAWLLFGLYDRVAGMAPWAPVLVIAIITAVVLAGYLLNRRWKRDRG